MKKIFFTLLMALFFCSCEKEMVDDTEIKFLKVYFSNKEKVNKNIQSDSLQITWNVVDNSTEKIVFENTKTVSTTFFLDNEEEILCYEGKINHLYSAICWIEAKTETAYRRTKLTEINVDYSNPTRKPAWCGTFKNITGKEGILEMNLVSPFATIYLYTEQQDLMKAEKLGMDMSEFSFKMDLRWVADTYYPLEPEKSFRRKTNVIIEQHNLDANPQMDEEYKKLVKFTVLCDRAHVIEMTGEIKTNNISVTVEMPEIPIWQEKITTMTGCFLTAEQKT